MNRYSPIKTIITQENPKPRYVMVKYPLITLASSDIYVYTTQGDRYDILALSFYNDSTLWWVINRANPQQDSNSLFPSVGAQIRIPSPDRIPIILSQFETLNK